MSIKKAIMGCAIVAGLLGSTASSWALTAGYGPPPPGGAPAPSLGIYVTSVTVSNQKGCTVITSESSNPVTFDGDNVCGLVKDAFFNKRAVKIDQTTGSVTVY